MPREPHTTIYRILARFPVKKWRQIRCFSGVVKPPCRIMTAIEPIEPGLAGTCPAGRCRADPDAAGGDADDRSGEGLFQPGFALSRSPVRGLIDGREQGFDLAELGRPFMSGAVDGALQQAETDFVGHHREQCSVEAGARLWIESLDRLAPMRKVG